MFFITSSSDNFPGRFPLLSYNKFYKLLKFGPYQRGAITSTGCSPVYKDDSNP